MSSASSNSARSDRSKQSNEVDSYIPWDPTEADEERDALTTVEEPDKPSVSDNKPEDEPASLIAVSFAPPQRTTSGSVAGESLESQTLEEYPALVSYALNKTFVHAKAASLRMMDPNSIIDKLVRNNWWSWRRWFALQEDVTEQPNLEDFLKEQGMEGWATVSEQRLPFEQSKHKSF